MSTKGTTLALKTIVGDSLPVSRNTKVLPELNAQFLRFGEMVKLTRIGKLTN